MDHGRTTSNSTTQNGDISGLEYLVMQHQVKAVRAAFLITRDTGLAEDVVHDIFKNVSWA